MSQIQLELHDRIKYKKKMGLEKKKTDVQRAKLWSQTKRKKYTGMYQE